MLPMSSLCVVRFIKEVMTLTPLKRLGLSIISYTVYHSFMITPGLIESMPCKKGSEKKLESAMGYFRSNMEHMNYGTFSACSIFVGSGVIEAGCKVIVSNRMKNAGMHWSKDNAEKMISLRCTTRNNSFLNEYLHVRDPLVKSAA